MLQVNNIITIIWLRDQSAAVNIYTADTDQGTSTKVEFLLLLRNKHNTFKKLASLKNYNFDQKK